jgi:glycosyltransferase involved in cell wall biosynthesis
VTALIDAHQVGLGQTGNETWARNVVQAVVDRGRCDAHVAVSRQGARSLAETVEPDRLHVVSDSSSRRLAVDLPLLAYRVRPGALLVQYTLPPLVRVPGVVMVHDLSFERPEARDWIPPRTLLRYRATIRAGVRRAVRVLVPTEWTRRDMVERYGLDEGRVEVAGNAVDAELAGHLARCQLTPPSDRLVVLAVGTVLPRKNLRVAATAVARLRTEGLPVVFRLVGPVPVAGRLELARMSACLGPALEVTGQVTTRDLAHAYLTSHALAFPSLFEGFGIPLVEAMAAGLPVVSSDATCLPEVGGDAVRYACPSDVDAWTDALRQVLTDRDTTARLAAAGRRRAAEYCWDRTAAAVERALAEAAG